jgi:hypothetical protein
VLGGCLFLKNHQFSHENHQFIEIFQKPRSGVSSHFENFPKTGPGGGSVILNILQKKPVLKF